MCGVAGIWDPEAEHDQLQVAVEQMACRLRHRGPDQHGSWTDPDLALALGHQRLSIIDLSAAGNQPMHSRDGRHVLAFNGEIYNHQDLRTELDGDWRGHSDTEALLAALATWGVEATLPRLNGMFAFALWDRLEHTLTLARDPIGEKPLYLAVTPQRVAFASELGPLRGLPWIDDSIDQAALAAFFGLGYVPSPASILTGVRQLQPGTFTRVRLGDDGRMATREHRYWSLADVATAGIAARDTLPASIGELHKALRQAVGMRMAADVPLGAFLSGGLDSSLIVALMQEQASSPVRTFTVSMDAASHDEGQQAADVAAHLGTDHTTIPLSSDAGLDLIPELAGVYGEPYADPSGLPVLLLSRLTRQHVTVAVSGDGGDEVMGGYNRYTLGRAVWEHIEGLPLPSRRFVAGVLRSTPPTAWDRVVALIDQMTPMTPPRLAGDKVHKLAGILDSGSLDEVYLRLARAWQDPPLIDSPPAVGIPSGVPFAVDDPIDRMMLMDGLRTLPDQMLTKVDRASMAASLEVRVPLLDPNVISTAWRMAPELKVAGSVGKVAFRQILGEYVPPALWDRPKIGFDPPIGEWLRGPLRPWAEDLLSPSALRADGLLDVEAVRTCWAEHRLGRRNHEYRLWAVLMYRSWRLTRVA